MDIAQGLAFLGVELVLILLALLAIVRNGFVRLNSSIGIARDGFPPGKSVPAWSLPDLEGHLRVTPAGDHRQLLIFANRSLVAFPDLVTGINHLAQTEPELEVLVLSNEDRDQNRVTMQGLDLQVPLLSVDQAFYEQFRVRVMPFAFFLDAQGIVRWVGLINTEAQLFHAWRIARAMIYAGSTSQEV